MPIRIFGWAFFFCFNAFKGGYDIKHFYQISLCSLKRLSFFKRCDAATAIEYSLIAAGIALAIIVIAFALGGTTDGLFVSVSDALATYF